MDEGACSDRTPGTEGRGSLGVSCDKMTHVATRLAGPANYGVGCHGLRTRAWSIPYHGNAFFGAFAQGDFGLSFYLQTAAMSRQNALGVVISNGIDCTILEP